MEPMTILGNLVIPDDRVSANKDLVKISTSDYNGFNYRAPSVQGDLDCCGAQVWHHDGKAPAIIVWSNIYPTEVKMPDGGIVTAEPYDVVLLDNLAVEHRVPPALLALVKTHLRDRYVTKSTPMPNRHFIRTHLNSVPADGDIERWRREIVAKQRDFVRN